MNYSYDIRILNEAMDNLGEMVEYWMEACDGDPTFLFQMFEISGIAKEWEHGNTSFILGYSGTELCNLICRRVGYKRKSWPKALVRYDSGYTFWMGWILAYLQWHRSESFHDLLIDLTFEDLARFYPTLHTASEEKCIEVFSDHLRNARQETRLQYYRKLLGLSQRELAERSGVNVRTLQQYEIKDKDINKAAAKSVISLANVLHRQPEDLLEE